MLLWFFSFYNVMIWIYIWMPRRNIRKFSHSKNPSQISPRVFSYIYIYYIARCIGVYILYIIYLLFSNKQGMIYLLLHSHAQHYLILPQGSRTIRQQTLTTYSQVQTTLSQEQSTYSYRSHTLTHSTYLLIY